MVHEGFHAPNGQSVLVRIDDLPQSERENVGAFFRNVRYLNELPHYQWSIGVTVGLLVTALAFIGITGLSPSTPETSAWLYAFFLSSVIGAFCGVMTWVFVGLTTRWEELANAVAILNRNERCRIALEQLRRTIPSPGELLVKLFEAKLTSAAAAL